MVLTVGVAKGKGVGGEGWVWGGGCLWLDIVGIKKGQTQFTPLSSVGVFFSPPKVVRWVGSSWKLL